MRANRKQRANQIAEMDWSLGHSGNSKTLKWRLGLKWIWWRRYIGQVRQVFRGKLVKPVPQRERYLEMEEDERKKMAKQALNKWMGMGRGVGEEQKQSFKNLLINKNLPTGSYSFVFT